MGKKKNVSARTKKNVSASAAAAGSSQGKTIDELKTLNKQLVDELSELQKQIKQLRFQIDSLAADHDILAGIERDILGIVLSSTLSENAARANAEMDVLKKKEESAAAKVDAVERQLIAARREEDEIRREIERVTEERNSSLRERALENARKVSEGGRKWQKWMYPCIGAAVVTASVGIVKAVIAFKDSK